MHYVLLAALDICKEGEAADTVLCDGGDRLRPPGALVIHEDILVWKSCVLPFRSE